MKNNKISYEKMSSTNLNYHTANVMTTQKPFSIKKSIPKLFEEQTQANPNKVAIRHGKSSLTYEELNNKANVLAAHLRTLGVENGTPVAISLNRSIEAIVAMIGILKAGGAYVPLDPSYPRERIQFMIEDAGIEILLTTQEVYDRLDVSVPNIIDVNQALPVRAFEQSTSFDPQQLAYINYTSGSTGTPKGVCIPHQGVVRLVKNTSYANFTDQEVFLQYSNLSFDALTFEVWGALLNGAELVIFQGDPLSFTDFHSVINTYRVSALFMTAEYFKTMVDYKLEAFQGLSQLLVGGDVVSPIHVQKLYADNAEVQIINAYGPTENTTFSCCFKIPREWQGETLPIGPPIDHSTAYVCDLNGNLTPIGKVGELYVGGDGVALGYLNRPELTADRFIPDSFSGSGTLYKTGDLVRWDAEGNLEYIGRKDNQVKIRGFRIEVGEVEATLQQIPSVKTAAVIVREDEGTKQLVAYVVATEDLDLAQLRREAADRLPNFMMPAAFVALPALPLTPNGKVNRQALADLPRPEYVSQHYAAPETETERTLCTVWEEILGVSPIGVTDNFFELGGHSLMAARLAAQVANHLKKDLSVRDIFASPTVAQLSNLLVERATTDEDTDLMIPKRDQKQNIVLSSSQRQLWLIDQMTPDTPLYNVPMIWKLQGRLDYKALDYAVNEVVRRHESLRTIFKQGPAGDPVQEIVPFTTIPMHPEVYTELSDKQLETFISEEIHLPFDLANGPLWRVKLIQQGSTEYVFMFTMHHIVSDGWSVGILAEELNAFYAAYTTGEPNPLGDLPIQYGDYAMWQNEYYTEARLSREIMYWKDNLQGDLPVLALPTDYARPVQQTYNGSRYHFPIDASLLTQLKEISHSNEATLFMTLLALYNVLLMKYTGQTDILVGVPSAGRTHPQTENLIGYFVNTLVHRTAVSEEATFIELLNQVKETSLDALSHQRMPFERLVEMIEPTRDPSYSPLIQTLFVLQNNKASILKMAGVETSQIEIPLEAAKYDVVFEIIETDKGLSGVLEYNTDLFELVTIERMAEHFISLIKSTVTEPENKLSSLSMLTNNEKDFYSNQLKQKRKKYPKTKTISQLFEEQVQNLPLKPAVRYGDNSLTYEELNSKANVLAAHLRTLGVENGTPVAISLNRSIEAIVAMIGILKAGGAYVPLDPSYPRERIQFMIEDAGIEILLTTQEVYDRLDVSVPNMIDVNQALPVRAFEQSTSFDPQQLAYINYTSGSTGTPKGVCIPHQGVVRLVKNTSYANFTDQEVFLQYSNLSFDALTFEVWGALLNGAELVIFQGDPLSLVDFHNTIKNYKISTLLMTAEYFKTMVDYKLEAFQGLSQLLVGGDVVSPIHVQKLYADNAEVQIINAYGPTENSTISSCFSIPREWQGETLPIGPPIDHSTAYVCDLNGNLAPIGKVGELYVGGDGVALGYLNRPELTADRFIPDSFSGSGTLYKTGDLVRWDAEGNLEYIGRKDNQVKIRGFRIEVGEVEATLQQIPSVKTAAVIVREDEGTKQLVAYVVATEDLDLAQLRREAADRLPNFMMPAAFVALPALPLTPNGKVNRQALADLPRPEYVSQHYAAPETETERTLCTVWEEILGVSPIGVTDNFFELGGHSLMAARLAAQVANHLKKDLSVRDIFASPTVAQLSNLLVERATTDEDTDLMIPKRDQKQNIVLSSSQRQLWLIDQMTPDTPLYNVPMIWKLQGRLDYKALDYAVNEVVRRHESLRTIFKQGPAGDPVQEIVPFTTIPMHPEVYTELSDKQLETFISEEIHLPFDLANGPLWRVKLIQQGSTEYVFMFTMHHIVSDGWSVGILAEELNAFYAAYTTGEPNPLGDLPIQYGDYAMWQNEYYTEARLSREIMYWKDNLQGDLPVLALPTDYARPVQQTYNGSRYHFPIDASLLTQLKEISHSNEATLFMTLLALYNVLLMKYTGQTDILVGVPSAGRTHPQTENLIGYFVNTLVHRTAVSEEATFIELLNQVKETSLDALSHQRMPFERLVEMIEPTRDPSYSPLIQTLFVLQSGKQSEFDFLGVVATQQSVPLNVAKFDIVFEISEVESGLSIVIEYNTDLFELVTIERMAKHFNTLIQSTLNFSTNKIEDLTLISEEELNDAWLEFE